jgi:hypothetical protein
MKKSEKMKEPTIVRGFSDDEPYEYANGGGIKAIFSKEGIEASNPFAFKKKLEFAKKHPELLMLETGGNSTVKGFGDTKNLIGKQVKVDFRRGAIGTVIDYDNEWVTVDYPTLGFAEKVNLKTEQVTLVGKYAKGSTVKGGNVRSLLSQFQKEKPIILIQMIADDVSSEFMRKKFDETIVWSKLSDSQKEKYNEDYRENKFEFIKYLIYEFLKLYYSNDTIKNKCKGKSRATISAIKSVMVSLAKDYPSSKMADGGMMAKGGDVKDNFDWSKMSFNERLILARESGLEKPSKIAITEIGLLKPNEISALKNSIRLRNEVYGDNTMMADGGMMAKGGGVEPQFEDGVVLVKSAKASNHNEVWDILNEKWKKYKIVNSRKWDLETPYNRGWINEGISINVYLLKDTETNRYYWDSNYIEAKNNKMAKGGLLGGFNYSIGGL